MPKQIRWGILATGNIAGAFADGLKHSKTGRLVAVGSRSKDSAVRFGERYGLAGNGCHGSYEELLANGEVDAVYISNPHPGHAEWSIRAAQAGKHLLCEKPLAMNAAEAATVIDAARRHDVFLMEAFMYRCHPQTQRLVELLAQGAIGRVRVIQATFSFRCADDPKSRLLDPTLGGGGILDVGCYPVSMTRLIAGVAMKQAFADPLEFKACGHLGVTGVDDYTVAVASFPGEIFAQLSTGVRVRQESAVRIYGEEGSLILTTPWAPGRDGGTSFILHQRSNVAGPESIPVETPVHPAYLYTLEADHVAACLDRRQSPTMSWEDSLGNMRTLDRWRAAIGLAYPQDRAATA